MIHGLYIDVCVTDVCAINSVTVIGYWEVGTVTVWVGIYGMDALLVTALISVVGSASSFSFF